VTPQDVDMIDYCYHQVIASKDHEIEVLKKKNVSLMRDHEYKDTEMEILKRKYRSLKDEFLKQRARLGADAEYREREFAIEKKQLLREIDWALRGVAPEDDEDMSDDEDSIESPAEYYARKEMLRRSPLSVRDLIQEREVDIAKYGYP
jgi:hypothetical protein